MGQQVILITCIIEKQFKKNEQSNNNKNSEKKKSKRLEGYCTKPLILLLIMKF